MENFSQFILNINDLPLGISSYDFVIEDWFFEKFDYSEIKKCRVSVNLYIDKTEKMFILQFQIDGFATVSCDRCGDLFDQPLKGSDELILKRGHKDVGDEIDIVCIDENLQSFDISQFLYEYISLLLPMHHVHPADSFGNSLCNADTLKTLEKLSPEHRKKSFDPRWEKLKKLKLDK